MNKLINAIQAAPKRSIALAAVLLAMIVPAAISAWGPSRDTHTMEKPADYVTFNSITNNPDYGDERNFVTIKGVSDQKWVDEITVENGKEYYVRMYVHNNAAANLNKIAENVTAQVDLPTRQDKRIQIDGYLSSSNATPTKIWDQVVFKSDVLFSLDYVKGSATYTNKVFTQGTSLSDSILTSGVKLGYDKLDGKIPGCLQYSGWVLFKVKAITSDFLISKTVRVDGLSDTSFKETVTAKPGDTVDFQIYFKNTGGTQLKDVIVKDTLPKGLTYVPKSTYLITSTNGKQNLADGITEGGINIGGYLPGGEAYIKISAKVASNNSLPACGSNTLTNSAKATTSIGYKEDPATVYVTRTCDESKDPTYICSALNTKKLSRTKFQFSTNHSSTSGATYKSTTYVVREDKSYLPLEVARQTITSGDFTFETTKVGKYTVEAIITFTVNGKDETTSIGNCKTSFEVTEEGKEEEPKPEYCIIPGKEHLPAGHKDCSYPKAGPAGIIGSIIGLGSLTSSAAYYVISRRKI